jgi:hypothetical protein
VKQRVRSRYPVRLNQRYNKTKGKRNLWQYFKGRCEAIVRMKHQPKKLHVNHSAATSAQQHKKILDTKQWVGKCKEMSCQAMPTKETSRQSQCGYIGSTTQKNSQPKAMGREMQGNVLSSNATQSIMGWEMEHLEGSFRACQPPTTTTTQLSVGGELGRRVLAPSGDDHSNRGSPNHVVAPLTGNRTFQNEGCWAGTMILPVPVSMVHW